MDYSELKRKGKALLAEGDIKNCLQLFEEALKLTPDDGRIQTKVEALRQALEDEVEEEGGEEPVNSEMKEISSGFYLHSKIYSKLFPYQKEGLKWMYSLYRKRKGGVLGDDMGLGKTVQVVSYLAGLFDMELIKSVLLIMPVSLIGNWLSEFEKWAPGISVYDYHSGTKREKEISLKKVMNRGGVILTSYGMVTTRHEEMCSNSGRKFVWDYVILDEGHKIKNPTKTQTAIFSLLASHRLILTGTAVQNNLRELWSLYHFTHQGTLFGNLAGFKQDFENPINRGREKDATAGEREMGVQLARQLKEMIAPYFLRRTKAEVFRNGDGPKIDAHKEDLVLWTFLSETQQQLYRDFLESDQVKDILLTSKSPLVQLNILKKICDHPRLLPKKACVQLGLCDEMSEDEIREFLEDDKHCPFSIDDVSDEDLLNESGKMKLMLQLTENLKKTGHRTLIFSTSRRILDMIQRILRFRRFSIARLDGTITKNVERKRIVDDFQKNGKDVFLLTTQVGGVGLTLTNADRVIIYDPNWNPATDAQAVDRAFRIGQERDVIVYRMITCGTVEEKIYARQIFKDSIIKQTTGNHTDPTRYFTRSQLRELFVLNDPMRSETKLQLDQMHTKTVSEDIENHISFLMATDMVFGVTHHDLMFSTEEKKEYVPEEQRLFISHQVQRARVLREKDAEIIQEDLRSNPHLVPTFNFKNASAKNMAASMSSTVNPANLRDRPEIKPEFIDLSQCDDDDLDYETKDFKNKSKVSSDDSASFVIVESDDDCSIVEIKTKKEKTTEPAMNVDNDIQEIVVVKKADDTSVISNREKSPGTRRPSPNSFDEEADSFHFGRKRHKQKRIEDSDESEENNDEEVEPQKIHDASIDSEKEEENHSDGAEGDIQTKNKRRSVVFKRNSPDIPESEESNQSADSVDERSRIEQEAYDAAFEGSSDVDESLIEKTILEQSILSSAGCSFIVEDSFVEDDDAGNGGKIFNDESIVDSDDDL